MFGVIGESMFSTIPLAIEGDGREGKQDVIDDQDDIGPLMPDDKPFAMIEWKRNKKVAVSVVMICSPIRGTLEGAIASWTTSYASLSRRSLSAARGDQAGHD